MNKNIALTPPMGWNSWDCFGASVNEEQLMANAQYMEEHLKPYGYEYVVCDIEWAEPEAKSTEYNAFFPLCMDGYSRLIPAEKRFPSAKGGQGFRPIADKIHAMGLKFGIHIMRGIPRQAVHQNSPVKGTDAGARSIAQSYSVCPWNTNMYGVNPDAKDAQCYYDSLFELYASWGVDFVKVDDIANTEFKKDDPYSAAREIEMIRLAIDRCGREMVLSLSPGPAAIEKAWHLKQNANMWRMTGDFWDHWPSLYRMFERCEVWQSHVGPGHWPDCDMLPLGVLRKFNNGGEPTRFTKDEQVTVMTLWCLFRSPLMLGGHLPDNDQWTLDLITNQRVLRLNKHSHSARQLQRDQARAVWTALDEDGSVYLALFNLSDAPRAVSALLDEKAFETVTDVWSGESVPFTQDALTKQLAPHASRLLRLI